MTILPTVVLFLFFQDQYITVHKAVEELFERHLEMMNQHLYENIDVAGQPLSPHRESVSFIHIALLVHKQCLRISGLTLCP